MVRKIPIRKGRLSRTVDGLTIRAIIGIDKWAKVAWDERWVNRKHWLDESELAASIQSYIIFNNKIN